MFGGTGSELGASDGSGCDAGSWSWHARGSLATTYPRDPSVQQVHDTRQAEPIFEGSGGQKGF